MNDFFDTRYGWVLKGGLTDYRKALEWQHGLVSMRLEGLARDTIIILEHPNVITVGKDGHAQNFSDCKSEPIKVERGGDVTYHGPGQLVAYFVFNLTQRGRDLHRFMADLQQGIIDALKEIGIEGRPGDKQAGVWVGEKKIASVGVAVKRWISFHGVAINLNTDLAEFRSINPCGLQSDVMTSAAEILGKEVDIDQFGKLLLEQYSRIFVTGFEPVDLESLAEELESQAGGYTI